MTHLICHCGSRAGLWHGAFTAMRGRPTTTGRLGAHRRPLPQVMCIQHFTVDECEAIDGPSAGSGWGASRAAAWPAACHLWVCQHQKTLDSTYRANRAKSVRSGDVNVESRKRRPDPDGRRVRSGFGQNKSDPFHRPRFGSRSSTPHRIPVGFPATITLRCHRAPTRRSFRGSNRRQFRSENRYPCR